MNGSDAEQETLCLGLFGLLKHGHRLWRLANNLQNLSGEDAAHLLYRGPDPACSGQVSGRTEAKSHSSAPLERADVLSGTVDESLEPGGAGEERS